MPNVPETGNMKQGGDNMKYPNIAAERAKREMTLEQLAASLGVTRKTVYNWEKNGKIPQAALEKMSEIFGCSIDYLLSRTVA